MSVSIDISETLQHIDRVLLAMPSNKAFLQDIANYGKKKAEERILSTKRDLNGRAWTKWAGSTLYKRTLKGNAGQGLLFDSGSMLRGIVARVDGADAVIENNVPYATFHQTGTRIMPKREFMGWTNDDIYHIETLIAARFGEI